MSSEAVIHVKNLTKTYKIYDSPQDRLKQSFWRGRKQFYREFTALNNVSFKVKKGETVGIIGRNGSGKSTLLQIICGTLASSAGTVDVNGRVAALLELGSGFNPEFTGEENVYLNASILGLSKEEIDAKYDEIVGFADIGSFLAQPVKTYSSGMVVRLAFSVAINIDPEILVIDEALAVGDMPFQVKCFSHLRMLREKGTSILFVSHDLPTVRSFCDSSVYLEHGTCLAVGSANDVCTQYELDCIRSKFSLMESNNTYASSSESSSKESGNSVSKEVLAHLQSISPYFLEQEHEGSQSMVIESFVIVGENGVPVESIEPTQKVIAHVLFRLNRSLHQDFHCSIQIHDCHGMPLMVVRDSTFEGNISGDLGDNFITSMGFSLPLQAGKYYCKVAVLLFPLEEKYSGDHFNFENSEVADIVEYAAYFRILPYKRHNIPVPVLNESKLKISSVKLEFP